MIKKESLVKVVSGGDFKVSNQDDKHEPLAAQTIVSQAEKMVGQGWRYNPVTNNCETFATTMRYGKGNGFSLQVMLAQNKSLETTDI